MQRKTYTDASSGTQPAINFTTRRLATRFEPFGMRAYVWYDKGAGNLFGADGGAPLLKIIPLPIQPRDCEDGSDMTAMWQTTLGGNTTPDLDPAIWVDGGILWIPFAATVDIDWPDKDIHNLGTISWSFEPYWDTGLTELAYTRYATNGQVLTVPKYARLLECSNPLVTLTIPSGGPDVFQGQQKAFAIGGATSIKVTYLGGMPATVNRVPIKFIYLPL